MLDIVIIILLLFNLAVTTFGLLILGYFLIESRGTVGYDKEYDNSQKETYNRTVKKTVVNNAKPAELPPEILAPVILKPPKPAGGFGSKVTE